MFKIPFSALTRNYISIHSNCYQLCEVLVTNVWNFRIFHTLFKYFTDKFIYIYIYLAKFQEHRQAVSTK